MNRFKTLDLALNLYQSSRVLAWTSVEKNQFDRAALRVVLNLKEGSSRPSAKERRRFYYIALGSLREVQILLEIKNYKDLMKQADITAAHLYKLCIRTN